MNEDFNFLRVSKSYINYEKMQTVDKLKFWIRYPKAYAKFQYYLLKDRGWFKEHKV